MKKKSVALFKELQKSFCASLQSADGEGTFSQDTWDRTDSSGDWGGGGLSRLLRGGRVFEQAGVNFSEVHGTLQADMVERLVGVNAAQPFYATGISLVVHPRSPLIPTTHANFRYLQVADKQWFGGGLDLTPFFYAPEDFTHFHTTIRNAFTNWGFDRYEEYKMWCDKYFFLPHRGEARGVGGIFFDYVGREDATCLDEVFGYVAEVAACFPESYLPIVAKRRSQPFSEAAKRYQLLRRGRYVEFNLLYDRGTLFGLKTGGRVESVFMSFPPEAQWDPTEFSSDGIVDSQLHAVLQSPQDWADKATQTLKIEHV